MKFLVRVLLVAVLLLGVSVAAKDGKKQKDQRGYIVNVGDKAPSFSLKLADGRVVKSTDLQGKIVMLQFTASWCSVCRKEMPFIERDIWQKNKDNPDFALYAVDMDEPLDKANELINATGITYPVALDDKADVFALFAHRKAGVTRNVIIGKDGKIKFLTRLFNQEEFDTMVSKINELLSE